MQHTIVILTILLPEAFRRKWAPKWPIFDETPLYRKSFKFAEYARGAGSAVSPIQFFELILNNRPRFARAKSVKRPSETVAQCAPGVLSKFWENP